MTSLHMVRPGKSFVLAFLYTEKTELTDQNEHLAYKYVKVGLKSIYTGMEALSKVVKSLEPKMRQGLSSVADNFVKCCDLL